MQIVRARQALERAQTAASPEAVREALADLFTYLAEGYAEADAELSAAWQDRAAGRPWRRLAHALDGWADRVQEV